jgi:polyhydroxybutyrate depolymerase
VAFLALSGLRSAGSAGVASVRTPEPKLSAPVAEKRITIGGLSRHYLVFVPKLHAPKPALVIMLHGSLDSSSGIRRELGYVLDLLADRFGFVTLYPDGFERHWNDCRKKGAYSAKRKHIDDVGFLRTLIQTEETTADVDPGRVFIAGYSNGAQMAYRMALEDPDDVTAIAAMCAGLPTAENMDCMPKNQPVSVLIMNGTGDPYNPYKGGDVSFLGFGDRGNVLSTPASAEYFVALDRVVEPPQITRLPHPNKSDSTWIEERLWAGAAGKKVALFTVHGGGHTLPRRQLSVVHALGRTNHDADAAQIVWSFFDSLGR